MARLRRLAAGGYVHHVRLRAHSAASVFADVRDCEVFKDCLRRAAAAEAVLIHAYTLLDAEVQLLASPAQTAGLGRLIQQIGRCYGWYFNRRHARRGALWSGRFRAAIIEPENWLLTCTRYIERLAESRGLVARASDHMWSSLRHHLGVAPDPLVSDHSCFWQLGNTPFERELRWKELIERALTVTEVSRLEQAIAGGWVLGRPDFQREVSERVRRRVSPAPRGRPCRNREADAQSPTDQPPQR